MADLTTLANLKEYLKIPTATTTDDALLGSLIVRVSAFIRDYLGRTITDEGTLTEYHDGLGRSYVMLNEYPILTLTTVHDDPDRAFGSSALIATADLIQEEDLGIIRRKFGVPFQNYRKNVQIVYTAGYAAVPGGIEQVVIEVISAKYKKLPRIGVQSRSLKDGSRSYFSSREFSTEQQGLLSPYRRESR